MATNYFWDEIEDNVVREYDDNNNTIAHYTTEPTPYGSVLSQERSGVTHFYHFDGLGNTSELTDLNTNVTDIRRYSAFGEATTCTGVTEFPWEWMGRWGYFNDSHLYSSSLLRARYLNRQSGRFLSPDPLVYSPIGRSYHYSNHNPANEFDPSGHITLSVTKQQLNNCKCGGGSCINWKVVPKTLLGATWPCSMSRVGFLIQKVTFYCTIDTTCKACPTDPPKSPTITYLELKGAIEPIPSGGLTRTLSAQDISQLKCVEDQCGAYKAVGEWKFFCGDKVGDLRDPAVQKANKWQGKRTFTKGDCEIVGGGLTYGPIDDALPEPSWWTGETGNKEIPATRFHSVTYNCCTDCVGKKDMCTADAKPRRTKDSVTPPAPPPSPTAPGTQPNTKSPCE